MTMFPFALLRLLVIPAKAGSALQRRMPVIQRLSRQAKGTGFLLSLGRRCAYRHAGRYT
jgi:hypothetical protein